MAAAAAAADGAQVMDGAAALQHAEQHYTVRFPNASRSQDGRAMPSLLSLLTTRHCPLLLGEFCETQLCGSYHTVELAAHLALMPGPPAPPPSTMRACELYQSYCTSDSAYPVACVLLPATLERVFALLQAAQRAGDASVPHSTFDALLDEVCFFLLPFFRLFLRSPSLLYSSPVERLLLSPAGSGPQELFYAIAREGDCEELVVFMLDFHAALIRFRDSLPPKLIACVKRWEGERKKKAAKAAADRPNAHLFAPALEDGFEIDSADPSAWVLSARAHTKLVEGETGCIPRACTHLPSRPKLPAQEELMTPPHGAPHMAATATPAAAVAPNPATDGAGAGSSQHYASIPSIVSSHLSDILLLYEKYLQPSATSGAAAAGVRPGGAGPGGARNMLQATLLAASVAGRLSIDGSPEQQQQQQRGGRSQSATPAHSRQGSGSVLHTSSSPSGITRGVAEFPIRSLPYYLLRAFLDELFLCKKFFFISHALEKTLMDIKNWIVRDLVLRRGLLKRYYEAAHFGKLGREIGLAHGRKPLPFPTTAAIGGRLMSESEEAKLLEATGWSRAAFDTAPKPPPSRPPSPPREVIDALAAAASAAANAVNAQSNPALAGGGARSSLAADGAEDGVLVGSGAGAGEGLMRRAFSDGEIPQLAEFLQRRGGSEIALLALQQQQQLSEQQLQQQQQQLLSTDSSSATGGGGAMESSLRRPSRSAAASEAPVTSVAAAAAAAAVRSAHPPHSSRSAHHPHSSRYHFVPAHSSEAALPPHLRAQHALLAAQQHQLLDHHEPGTPILPLMHTFSPVTSPRHGAAAAAGAAPMSPLSAAFAAAAGSALSTPSNAAAAAAAWGSGTLVMPAPRPLLPALPFQPPQRSFNFPSVGLYRKHVLGESRRAQKEEEEREQRRDALMLLGGDGSTMSSPPGGGNGGGGGAGGSQHSSAAANGSSGLTSPHIHPRPSTPHVRLKQLSELGGSAQQGGSHASHGQGSGLNHSGSAHHHLSTPPRDPLRRHAKKPSTSGSSAGGGAPRGPSPLRASSLSPYTSDSDDLNATAPPGTSVTGGIGSKSWRRTVASAAAAARAARNRKHVPSSGDDLDLFWLQERAPHLFVDHSNNSVEDSISVATSAAGSGGSVIPPPRGGSATLEQAMGGGSGHIVSASSLHTMQQQHHASHALSPVQEQQQRLSRKRILFEQIQSLRYLHAVEVADDINATAPPALTVPSSVGGAMDSNGPGSAAGSPARRSSAAALAANNGEALSIRVNGLPASAAELHSTQQQHLPPSHGRTPSASLSSCSSAAATPRSRAVRFSATARHEVREFDVRAEAAGHSPIGGNSAAKKKHAAAAAAAAAAPPMPLYPLHVGDSPGRKARSILKSSPTSQAAAALAEATAAGANYALTDFSSAGAPSSTSALPSDALMPPTSAGGIHSRSSSERGDSASPELGRPPSATDMIGYVAAVPSVPSALPAAPSYSALMRRIYEERQRETSRLLCVLQRGAVFLKMHSRGEHAGVGISGSGGRLGDHLPADEPHPSVSDTASNSPNGRSGQIGSAAASVAMTAAMTAAAAAAAHQALPFGQPGSSLSAGSGGVSSGVNSPALSLPAPPRSGHRFFYISPEATELHWCKLVQTSRADAPNAVVLGEGRRMKPARKGFLSKHKSQLLADGLRLFADSFHSPHFLAYNQSLQPPWLCLTLLLTERCFDLIALSELQAEEWFFGLQALIPLNPSFRSKPLYRWNRLRLKIQYRAVKTGSSVAKTCRQLITQARQEIHMEQQQQQQQQQMQQQQHMEETYQHNQAAAAAASTAAAAAAAADAASAKHTADSTVTASSPAAFDATSGQLLVTSDAT